jgi:hypothetical protein
MSPSTRVRPRRSVASTQLEAVTVTDEVHPTSGPSKKRKSKKTVINEVEKENGVAIGTSQLEEAVSEVVDEKPRKKKRRKKDPNALERVEYPPRWNESKQVAQLVLRDQPDLMVSL